ncbi:BA75_00744T0 [Komagataella pastoris]|uniref:Coatomer subunit zeta n=1 Tax=Komagataella pastoris TaxID=4922 RepID=A0A1B2J8X7_PICPA|nr:BA75_00744T0 [Komagataella pastoris]
MTTDVSLYTVDSVIILDSTGSRVLVKYSAPPHAPEDSDSLAQRPKQQVQFEKSLFQKTHKVNGDIVLFENKTVVYKEFSDVVIYIVGGLNENECFLFNVLQGLVGALEIVLKYSIDKKTIQENYDMVSLAVDETIDDGIVLETDPSVIAARVSKAPTEENSIKIDLSEEGLFNAFKFARSRVADRLQQGF